MSRTPLLLVVNTLVGLCLGLYAVGFFVYEVSAQSDGVPSVNRQTDSETGAPATIPSGSTNSVSNPSGSVTNPAGQVQNPGPPGQLKNPLQSKSIEEFLLKIIDVILVFALPIIILYIMYAGYLFVTARGDTGQIETARTALLWSVVGGVIVLGARLILGVIQGTIQSF